MLKCIEWIFSGIGIAIIGFLFKFRFKINLIQKIKTIIFKLKIDIKKYEELINIEKIYNSEHETEYLENKNKENRTNEYWENVFNYNGEPQEISNNIFIKNKSNSFYIEIKQTFQQKQNDTCYINIKYNHDKIIDKEIPIETIGLIFDQTNQLK
jgi:hypothetical protein